MSSLFFDRDEHVFHSPTFKSVVREAIQFLEQSEPHALPLPDRFMGPGVYALYYTGDFPPYAPIARANSDQLSEPIYVGKAVPSGRRQGRERSSSSAELYNRINEHRRSIQQAENIDVDDFSCRFVILENEMTDIIVTVESALVRKYHPLWNSVIDGFGNHDPGRGRYDQQPSEWDTLHPGRSWADKLRGEPRDRPTIISKIEEHYS